MEAFTDSIRLRALGLGPRMIDVCYGKMELVFMMLGIAAIFGAAIGQQASELHLFLIEQGHDAIVHEIGCRNRRLAIIEFRQCELRIGVDEGLLILISL